MKKETSITIRLSNKLKKLLQKEATKDDRDLAAYCRKVLKRRVK